MKIIKISSIILIITSLSYAVDGQPKFLTVAEKSDFKSTSDYMDVMTFTDQLKQSSKYIRMENIAMSTEGRNIPLLVIGNPLPKSPSALINDERLVIYIQANIHAGEVEGKEASLMFARDLLDDKNPELLKHLVILICPNFNPDGNEKISSQNRTYQNGPINGVGVRQNGQFLDLNRDAMKAESPEVRGVVTNVFKRWDPALFMDCHTTNGSYHVEPVTFTWMVNPDGDNQLIKYMQNKMVPDISSTLYNKYRVENCFYGEFNDMMKPENGWYYDAAEPRYMTNYYGLRNRLAILNENYVYADFKSRVMGCYYLIRSASEFAAANKVEIKKMLKEADARTIQRGSDPAVTDSFAIQYKVRPLPEKITIKTYEAEIVTDQNGRRSTRRSDRQKTVTIPYYIDFYPSKNVKFPYAYLLTINDPDVLDLLKTQGIRMEKLTEATKTEAERFEITELRGSQRLNQGHYTNIVNGKFIKETIDFPAGTLVIRTDQQLANLAAYLLEPQSNDGLMTWNYFDKYLVPQWGMGYYPYPVYRIINRIDLKTKLFE
jgi:hypothetical protein